MTSATCKRWLFDAIDLLKISNKPCIFGLLPCRQRFHKVSSTIQRSRRASKLSAIRKRPNCLFKAQEEPSQEFGERRIQKQRLIARRATQFPIQAGAEVRLYNFKAIIAYRGNAYKGWQIQNGKSRVPTVQEKVEAAICAIKCESRLLLRLQGAGRTDAGVHARGQVINFYSSKLTPPLDKLLLGINAHLPPDIRVHDLIQVPTDFSARYSALSKRYSFRLQTGPVRDPFQIGLSQHVFRPLDVAAMQQAAQLFVGRHDFTQFSSVPAVSQPLSPIKKVFEVKIDSAGEGMTIWMHGSGFMYNQCRHMAGCLIAVGLGRMTQHDIARLLEVGSKERPGVRHRGWTLAAAEGLYLEEVRYPRHDDCSQLLYPDLPHDKFGRVYLDGMPPEEVKAIAGRMKQLHSSELP